ncbi:SIS domain-containing protein [Cryptosporangium sp. NPDC051539]|uniref:SIS domain-containing protein n=1 Tax=Cryptosporangium sp. NPDC051539 TaxID=3363962 RepID=UPI0037909DD3
MTGFLYPFLDHGEQSGSASADTGAADALLADLADSARAKAADSARLQESTLAECGPLIDAAAEQLAGRFARGGRLYTFGNGGSSTDAATLAALFSTPARGRPLPAWSLAADQAVLTALGNDIGFDVVFSRQLIAHARPGDIAAALSTSGNSEDLTVALAEARKRGLLTLGFAGYDGGRMAASGDVDYCFTVRSQSVHRIQESQAVVGYRLWEATQQHLTNGEHRVH